MNRKLVFLLFLFLPCLVWPGVTFNGSTQWCSRTGRPTTSTKGTLMAWINVTSIPGNNAIAIFTYGGDAATNAGQLGFRVEDVSGVKKLTIIHRNDGGTVNGVAVSSITINDQQWHHVAVTSNGSAWALYIDGISRTIEVTNGSNTGAWYGNTTVTNGQTRIGGLRFNGTDLQQFNGSIDDVRLYDRVLTDTEIQSLGQSRSRLDITDYLIGYWPLDTGNDGAALYTGAVVYDATQNGFTFTAVAAPTWKANGWISYP